MSHALHYDGSATCSCQPSIAWSSRLDASPELVRKLTRKIHDWIEPIRQCRVLHDIGVSREGAAREPAKLFWQTYARRHLK